jgi:hypothetical protein
MKETWLFKAPTRRHHNYTCDNSGKNVQKRLTKTGGGVLFFAKGSKNKEKNENETEI